jgi:ubiquinone/menaquinone biosynthesis C-methylase UbiE
MNISEHYRNEAEKHGLSGTCTIQDIRTRILELEAICSYIKDGQHILEVGCGNGFVADQIAKRFNVAIDTIDISPEMIALAKKRSNENYRGHVFYLQGDILDVVDIYNMYDLVFTERTLQNILSWEDQQKALTNIVNALKPGAEFIMLESFYTGMNELNEARSELNLPPIEIPWHNLWFDEYQTIKFMNTLGCSFMGANTFLSGYYFGSRVLLPALVKDKPVTSASKLNDYFCNLPPWGDFCPMKILRFKKQSSIQDRLKQHKAEVGIMEDRYGGCTKDCWCKGMVV